MTSRKTKKKKAHYVDNGVFTPAVAEYVRRRVEAEERGDEIPQVPDYIAECFLKIAEGITRTPKFVRRTYKDELIMDSVENCLRAIKNFKMSADTRSGNPNAFGYFSKIVYYAMLRRVEKEGKALKIKLAVMEKSAIESFLSSEDASQPEVLEYLDTVRQPYGDDWNKGLKKPKEEDPEEEDPEEEDPEEMDEPGTGVEEFME